MSSGESKDLRVAERGQLAKVYLRRTEGQLSACSWQLKNGTYAGMEKNQQTASPQTILARREIGGADDPATGCHFSTLSARQASLLFSCWYTSASWPHSYEDLARHLLPHLVDKLLPELLERIKVTDKHMEREQISSNQKTNTHITLYPAWDYWIKRQFVPDPKSGIAQQSKSTVWLAAYYHANDTSSDVQRSSTQRLVFYFSKCLFMNTSPGADTHPTIA